MMIEGAERFGLAQLQAAKMCEAIGYEVPDFMSISAAGKKYIFTQYNTLNVAIEMEQKIKLDMVLPLIKQAMS